MEWGEKQTVAMLCKSTMQSIVTTAMNISEQKKENEFWLSNISENIGLCTAHAQVEMSAALTQAVATDLSHTQVQSNS